MSTPLQSDPAARYQVSVQQYARFRRDGFLIVPQLLPPADIAELRQHTDDLMQGRLPEQQAVMEERDPARDTGTTVQPLEAPPPELSPLEKAQYFLRLHMLHRRLPLHERYLLHPRVLDVLQVLIGPDVLALQTMLFLKPPGKPGQGWHQDSYYIPTHPDTLCGAWIAIDDCDEQNGAMWFAKGSGVEPVYPPCPEVGYGFGDKLVGDITYVKGISDTDDQKNMLSKVADRYDPILASANAGDVVFFNGHVLHRSKTNWSADRFRRSFVGHYCNARSFTQWGEDANRPPPVLHSAEGVGSFSQKRAAHPPAPAPRPQPAMTNSSHILARGDTHLPFARPRFNTPCAALLDPAQRRSAGEYAARIIAANNNGLLGCAIADPTLDHNHDKPQHQSQMGRR
jgi:ectoine hydroxylase-related dioxygenase (phytanoyl-CoA dioxygenase family)